MRANVGFAFSCISVLFILTEGVLAYVDGMLTAEQMMQKHSTFSQGLPFIWHFGMWGDLLIITPIVGITVALYFEQWTMTQVLVVGAVGFVLSGVLHWIYSQTPFPDSLAWRGGISNSGYFHFLYMAAVFTIIGLLFFCTPRVWPVLLIIVSVALAVHVAIGNHVLLGLLNEHYHFAWCPEFLRKPDPWVVTAATCLILSALTWRSVGSDAGISVLGACSIFAVTTYLFATRTFSNGTKMGF